MKKCATNQLIKKQAILFSKNIITIISNQNYLLNKYCESRLTYFLGGGTKAANLLGRAPRVHGLNEDLQQAKMAKTKMPP